MDFINSLQQTLNEDFNLSMTENFALGYKTSGKNLLDLNFAVASLRGSTGEKIIKLFTKSYFDDQCSENGDVTGIRSV